MSQVRINLEELKAALAEIEARSKDVKVTIQIDERKLKITATDRSDNLMDAIIYEDGNLGAQFRCTERLMFMKEKKRV